MDLRKAQIKRCMVVIGGVPGHGRSDHRRESRQTIVKSLCGAARTQHVPWHFRSLCPWLRADYAADVAPDNNPASENFLPTDGIKRPCSPHESEPVPAAYSAACSVPKPSSARSRMRRAARTGSSAFAASAMRQIASAPSTPPTGDDQRDRADVVDDTGFEEQCARRRHRQEEGEVNHDRMFAAEAQKSTSAFAPVASLCVMMAKAPARPSASETTGHSLTPDATRPPLTIAQITSAASASHGPRPGAIRQREHVVGKQIAGIEIDEACAELVDHGPAGRDMRHLQQRLRRPDRERRGEAPRDSFVTTKKIGSR